MGFVVDFDLSTVLIFAVIWMGVIMFLRLKKKKSLVYLIFFTFFFVYIVKVLEFTQFPVFFTPDMRDIYGQTVWKTMNFIPFFTLEYRDLQTSLLNVLLTLPFGFGLPFITNLRFTRVVFIGVIFSVALEVLQLATALGAEFTFRVVDINDVMFNALGIIIGYIFFLGFVRGYHHILSKWGIPENPIFKYIYDRPQISKKM